MLHIATKIPEGRHLITTSASWAPLASRRKATRGRGTLGGDGVPGQQRVPPPPSPPGATTPHTLRGARTCSKHLTSWFLDCSCSSDGARGRCWSAGRPRTPVRPLGRGRRRGSCGGAVATPSETQTDALAVVRSGVRARGGEGTGERGESGSVSLAAGRGGARGKPPEGDRLRACATRETGYRMRS